jgi:hypothetical protein
MLQKSITVLWEALTCLIEWLLIISMPLKTIAINIPSDVTTIITTADVGLKSELVGREL